MPIIGISERYSEYNSIENVNSEIFSYCCMYYTTSSVKNAIFNFYSIISTERNCYAENDITYNEIECLYSSFDTTFSEKYASCYYYEALVSERYSYLPSYTSFHIQFNPHKVVTHYSDMYASANYALVSERFAYVNAVRYSERYCFSVYKSFTQYYSARGCTCATEPLNLSYRYCTYDTHHNKFKIVINNKEQEIIYTPNSDDVKRNLINNGKTIPQLYRNIFDIIKTPTDLSSGDVFIVYKTDVWKCYNLNHSSTLKLPATYQNNFHTFNGYFIFCSPNINYNLNYLIFNKYNQYPEKTSNFNEDDWLLNLKKLNPIVFENHDTLQEYLLDLYRKRYITFTLENHIRQFDIKYYETFKTNILIPFRIQLHASLYDNYFNKISFQ